MGHTPRCIVGLKIVGIALLYALLAKLVLAFFSDNGNVTLVWFPAGLGMATFLLGGKRYWPGVFIGAFVGGMLVDDAWLISVCIAIGNTLEPWIGAWLLLGNPNFSLSLRQPRDFAWLTLIGIITACFSALIGPMTLLLNKYLPPEALLPSMLHWWMADVLGIALVTPLILVWRNRPKNWFAPKRLLETLAFLGLSFLSGQAVFLSWFPNLLSVYGQAYWAFLFIVWAAVRFGRHGVLLLITMTAIQSLWGLLHQLGPFATENLQSGLLNIWFYLSILASVGLPLALTLFHQQQTNQALQQSEARLSFALETIGTGAWDLDLQDYSVQRTNIHDQIFGYSQLLPQWTYHTFLGHVVPEHRDMVNAGFHTARAAHSNWDFECRIRRIDGEIRWIRGSGCHQLGNSTRMAGILQDITEYKLADEDGQLGMLFYQNCNEAMMITDADATIVSINPAFSRITGYPAEDVIGKNASILGSGRQDESFFEAMWQTINTVGQWQGEIWNRRQNGELYVEQLSINTIFDSNGIPLRRIGLFFDITQRKLGEEQLWKQANLDPLTGIGNRRLFYDRLEQDIKKAQRGGWFLALLVIDIEHFKEINERFGYANGDCILQEAAQRVLANVRETDLVARMDGAAFAIILTELEKIGSVERIAKLIIHKLTEPFALEDDIAQLNCRIGIAIYPDDADTTEVLKQSAMDAAKKCASQSYRFANPPTEL
ncbi:sensor domain-containing diguanylate cyclase [Methylomonas albis]|uniref:Diguanylate cyclase n=1 Tax=Methylomonas albis TaxID=1854563 RepID=A0ABR9CXL1_9GAMM|nr:diguanylate cyclase [Methylomonas albis]MBD9354698.1 diguanylate cyclase [Methylomonas albis]